MMSISCTAESVTGMSLVKNAGEAALRCTQCASSGVPILPSSTARFIAR